MTGLWQKNKQIFFKKLWLTSILVGGIVAFIGSPAHAASPPTVINEPFTSGPGTMQVVAGGNWSVTNGEYQLMSPAIAETGNGNIAKSQTPLTGEWTVEVQAKVSSAPGEYSVIFDYSDPQNYSYAHFSTVISDFSQGVFKVQGGVVSRMASFNSPLAVNSLQAIKVKYADAKIKVYKAGTYLTGVDMTVRNGAMVGVGTTSGAATFDNFKVGGTVAGSAIAPLPQVTPPPAVTPPAAPQTCSNFTALRTLNVATAAELTQALDTALPGDDIRLADGTYVGNFIADTPGTAQNPIRITGSRQAVLNADDVDHGYVLHLKDANHWCVQGFSATNGQKGIVADRSSNMVIDNVEVFYTGDEAVHLRSCSSNNVVSNSSFHDTGVIDPGVGEGVYIGTAESNWGIYNFCNTGDPDPSDYNRVLNNTFTRIAAEHIDIKEGTRGGLIEGNHFDGVGMIGENHADSFIDVKGTDYIVRNNTGVKSGTSSLVDGFQTHTINVRTSETHSGTGNTFTGNNLNISVAGYGVNILTSNGGSGLVMCDNVVTGAALGLSNIACRP